MVRTERQSEVTGLNVGTIYQYFRDEAVILNALADREPPYCGRSRAWRLLETSRCR